VRHLDHDRIEYLLEMWDTHAWYDRKINKGGSWRVKSKHTMTLEEKTRLHKLCDWLLSHDTVKKQFVRNKIFIYSNDQEELEQLRCAINPDVYLMSEVILDRPQHSVRSRYPGYSIRAYFKSRFITGKEKKNLLKFIKDNHHALRTNVGVERFLKNESLRTRDYFFVDFRDHRLLGILELMVPSTVRKTADIIYDDK